MRKLFFTLLVLSLPALAAEKDYQDFWCTKMGGQTDGPAVRVKGGIIDCVTDRYAVEVDFGHKWKEGIAQARWYGLQTGKIPGLLLILEKPSDQKYVEYVEDYLHGSDLYLKVWTITPADLNPSP